MIRRIVLLGALAALAGCRGCDAGGGPAAVASAPAPVPEPPGLAAELVVPKPEELLADLRTSGASALLLPRTLGGLVVNVLGLPLGAADQVEAVGPVIGAAIVDGDATHAAIALHLREGAQLVTIVTAGKEAALAAERDGELTWLVPRATVREPRLAATLAVLDNYLVAGTDRDGVRALAPYLARTLARRAAPASDVVLDLRAAALHGPVRARLSSWGANLGALVPEAVRTLVGAEEAAGTLAGWLADAGAAHVEIDLGEQMLEVSARLEPASEADKQRIAELPRTGSAALGEVPDDAIAVVGWAETEAGRLAAAQARGERLVAMLGEADGVRGALEKVARGRGDRALVAVRCTGAGLTGLAHGDVTSSESLGAGLEELTALRKHPLVKKQLEKLDLRLEVEKTRFERVPFDVWRLRLAPAEKEPKREPVQLLYAVTGDRFLVTAGVDPMETLQHVYAPDPERTLATRDLVRAAIQRLPAEAALAAVVDVQGVHACLLGKPGGTFATPITLGVTTTAEGTIAIRLEVARPLLKLLGDQLGL